MTRDWKFEQAIASARGSARLIRDKYFRARRLAEIDHAERVYRASRPCEVSTDERCGFHEPATGDSDSGLR